MIQTNLVGQYVVLNHYRDEPTYQPIVAVTVDRDELTVWARNPDGVINRWCGDGMHTVKRPPLFEKRDFIQIQLEEAKLEMDRQELLEKLTELNDEIRQQVAE
jgi:hypothetical protein